MGELAVQREAQRLAADEARNELAAILDHVGLAVAAFDQSGALVVTNADYDRLFGNDAGKPTLVAADGTPIDDIAELRHRAGKEAPFTLRFVLRAPDGRQASFEAAAHRVGDGRGPMSAVLVVREVPDPKSG
jgi:PAS domain-containing protein